MQQLAPLSRLKGMMNKHDQSGDGNSNTYSNSDEGGSDKSERRNKKKKKQKPSVLSCLNRKLQDHYAEGNLMIENLLPKIQQKIVEGRPLNARELTSAQQEVVIDQPSIE